MSFKDYLGSWTAGKAMPETPARYAVNASEADLDSEILAHGEAVVDMEADVGANNVSWVRDNAGSFRACYVLMDGSIHELSFKQADAIWGAEARSPTFDAAKNAQELPNGIRVPRIPLFYIDAIAARREHKIQKQKTQQKLKKRALSEINRVTWHFNAGLGFSEEEYTQSVVVLPPGIFTLKRGVKRKRPEETQRERVTRILSAARDGVAQHPVFKSKLEECILNDVESIADLPNLVVEIDGQQIKAAQFVLSIFNFLHPQSTSSSPPSSSSSV